MILLSQLIDHYQKDLERSHGHEMLPSHYQALRARCAAGGKEVTTWFLHAEPVKPESAFPIPVVIEVDPIVNIMTANNGSLTRPPSCYLLPLS